MSISSPTDPSLWARAKAKALTKFRVITLTSQSNNWAAKWYKSMGGDWKLKSDSVNKEEEPMDKSSSTPNEQRDADLKDLLRTTAISAGLGVGAAGLYGLTKLIHDKGTFAKNRLTRAEKRISLPNSKKLVLKDPPASGSPQTQMLSDADVRQSDLSPELIAKVKNDLAAGDYDQQAKSSAWLSDIFDKVKGGYLHGALKPVAIAAPALAMFVVGKKLIDGRRKKIMDEQLAQAKQEFEAVLSKASSDLQNQVDAIHAKVAAKEDFQSGTKGGPPNTSAAESGIGYSPQNLAYTIPGLATGIGGLLGWWMMHQTLKKDPEVRKLRELQSFLKRDLASQSLSAGIDLEETPEGKSTFKL